MALPKECCSACGKEVDYLRSVIISLDVGEKIVADLTACLDCADRAKDLIVERMKELGAKVY